MGASSSLDDDDSSPSLLPFFETTIKTKPSKTKPRGVALAHLGNSIQYYNDCVRLLETMLLSTFLGRVVDTRGVSSATRKALVRSGSCLRGGATIPSLWAKGNGMDEKFSSRTEASKLPGNDFDDDDDDERGGCDTGAPTVRDLLLPPPNHDNSNSNNNNNYWDFIVINDHTQSPVRSERRQESMAALETHYLPAIAEGMQHGAAATATTTTTTTTVVFVQTMAYKTPVKNSSDLGTFDEFTEGLERGYEEYVQLVRNYNNKNNNREDNTKTTAAIDLKATVAPLGNAYRILREENFELWSESMYANDDFHPSPHGTLLEACILHCIVTGGQPFALFSSDQQNSDNVNVNNDINDPSPLVELLFKRARYMQPEFYPNGDPQKPLRLPTLDEAILLNDVAYRVHLEQQQHEQEKEQQQHPSKM